MKRFCVLLLAAAVLGGCVGGKAKPSPADEPAGENAGAQRGDTLYLGGAQWGDPYSFNPLAPNWMTAWPLNGNSNLMYEPLITYNQLNGDFEPLLGTLVSRDAEKVVVDINPAAKWSDGLPVTSVDVKFVFELGKRFRRDAANAHAIDFIERIKAETKKEGGERLTFYVNKEERNNPLVVLDLLLETRIVPAHVFERLLDDNHNNLSAVLRLTIDKNPVVSGPYNLERHSNERIVLKRRDDYWGNKALHGGKLPAPEYIIHPIYKKEDHLAIALQKGKIDASRMFIPRIWLNKRDSVRTWYSDAPYFVPGTMVMLLVNNTKAPLSDKNFRRAMAAAINYTDIRELAVCGYSPEMQPGLIINHGIEGKYFNKEDAKEHGVSYDPELAKQILADAGYESVYKDDGTLSHMVDRDGNRLPTLSIMVPWAWPDWEAIVKIAAKSLRSAGIDAVASPVDPGIYWPAPFSGNFDLIISKPAAAVTPSLPWSRFEAVMSSRNWVPIGGENRMNENQGRYNNPNSDEYNARVDELLREIPLMPDGAELAAAYRELNNIFMQDQPALPLCYLPEEFYEFSTRSWKGWPTAENPYAPPLLPWIGASTKILWRLQPVK